ncbi:ubiquitin-protein ligase peroxin 12 [Malassezia psittaci]|uniref:Peroxisome assembly protein 12 n=1 Tax=Malassezia psittaci TaxID=1821823 RepID=A0AAF0FEG2_9BASI|nr:ubiquitin-protein ligase peroxin 12 [Malassezia psittaci]
MDVLSSIDPTSSGGSFADPYRPSFFELIAQEQLSHLLKPAVRYVLTVLAQRNPRYLLRIVNRYDEIYALLMLAVERHYLRTWNSSFTENFYGLLRRRRPAVSTKRVESAVSPAALQASQRLRPRETNWSLLFLVGLPYLDTKLSQYWEQIGGGTGTDDLFSEESSTAQFRSQQVLDTRQQLKDLFRKGYPYIQVAYQLWMLAYNIGYLFGRTPYWRPWYRWMRVDIRRLQGNEQVILSPKKRPLPPISQSPVLFTALLAQRGAGAVFEALKYALPASIFFFKFLEWWYSPNNPRRRRGDDGDSETHTPIKPPAPLLPKDDGVINHPPAGYKDAYVLTQPNPEASLFADEEPSTSLVHNVCSLCGAAPIQNPCVLATGYAFCYTCAHAYVDKYHRCPVTLTPLPGGIEQIRKVLV